MADSDNSFSIAKSKRIYQFVWKQTASQQIVVCLIALLTLPLTLAPMELQRRIIDDAVGGSDLRLMAWLVGIYAAVVVAQQVTKFAYNYYQGRLSETMVRFLREKVLHGVDTESEADQEGTVVSMLSAEVEPIGGFAGTAFAQLVTEGGVLLAVFGYMLYTEFWLAIVAIIAFIPQAIATPLVQNRINEKAAKRLVQMREVGDDAVAVSRGEEARLKSAKRGVRKVFTLRLIIFRLKFALKATLNLLDHLADLAVLGVGGYMVIIGESNIGVVVAFLSGLGQLRSPWRTLITYFRVVSEIQIRFELFKEKVALR